MLQIILIKSMFTKLTLKSLKITQTVNRQFSKPTAELLAHLKTLGIKTKEIIYNPS